MNQGKENWEKDLNAYARLMGHAKHIILKLCGEEIFDRLLSIEFGENFCNFRIWMPRLKSDEIRSFPIPYLWMSDDEIDAAEALRKG